MNEGPTILRGNQTNKTSLRPTMGQDHSICSLFFFFFPISLGEKGHSTCCVRPTVRHVQFSISTSLISLYKCQIGALFICYKIWRMILIIIYQVLEWIKKVNIVFKIVMLSWTIDTHYELIFGSFELLNQTQYMVARNRILVL